eukprot:GHVL01008367.1.p1 GENE.GHVL01008367.1~~GHVL01008367.1.p1  ORF type:complete len:146 (+),score=12.96 GHVL01008367.1:20-457(+)
MSTNTRFIWTTVYDFLAYRAGRIYWSHYNFQHWQKIYMTFMIIPIWSYAHWRADTRLKYYVWISQKELYPESSKRLFSWSNGSSIYLKDDTTVKDLKNTIYKNSEPPKLVVGCKGRQFQDDDLLSMAVRSFCKNEPNLLMWEDSM